MPGIGGKQQHSANAPTDNIFSHYKVNLAISFLDRFLEKIKGRLNNKNCVAIKAILIVLSVTLKQYRVTKNVGEKRNYQDAFVEEATRKMLFVQGWCNNSDVAQPSSTSLKTSENFSAHGGQVLIHNWKKEWKRGLLYFCHQYHDDMLDKSHITPKVDNWESTRLKCPEKDVQQALMYGIVVTA